MCLLTFHRACAAQHPLLKPFDPQMCFECSLLSMVVRKAIIDTEADLYYRQLTNLANLKVTPLSLGLLSATLLLHYQRHFPTPSTSVHQCPALSLSAPPLLAPLSHHRCAAQLWKPSSLGRLSTSAAGATC